MATPALLPSPANSPSPASHYLPRSHCTVRILARHTAACLCARHAAWAAQRQLLVLEAHRFADASQAPQSPRIPLPK